MQESPLLNIIIGIQTQIVWLFLFAIGFAVLAKISPCNPTQPLWRKSAPTDIAYSLIVPIFTRFITIAYISVGIAVLFSSLSDRDIMDRILHGYGPLGALPIWAQAAIVFLASDFILYWIHRGFHSQTLWRWHAIHHSSPELDWLSAYRFHPVNTWLSFTLVDALMLLAGFSMQAAASMALVNMLYSAMVHANLNWTFGPFKYCFASPVFHRWHHTMLAEGRDKNFAPTFPLLDVVFGTFYMPDGKLPEHYGVDGSTIPDNSFFGQLVWPFRRS